MITRDFLAALAPHAEAPLHFDPGSGPVAPGYHVTEVKAVAVRAADCGGHTSDWNETVLQIVPPLRPAPQGMTVGKFLSIWQRVAKAIPIDAQAAVRVETAVAGTAAIGYLVDAVTPSASGITVHLAAPAVACKDRDRSVGHIPVLRPHATTSSRGAGSCCAPAGTDTDVSALNGACCG